MYWILIGAAVVIFFFNPFQRNKPGDIYKPRNPRSSVTQNLEYLLSSSVEPVEYVTGLFATRDIVFVGEFDRVRQHVLFIDQLIPELYEAGVYNLGIQYALFSDQDRIDQILNSDTYDEIAVHEILHNRMVIWGYQEYADLFRTAWKLNSSLPDEGPKFRIVGLNVAQRWEFIKTMDDIEDPEVIAKVISNGIPDVAMANVILDEFVANSQKALIFTSMQHAFTDYVNNAYVAKAEEQNIGDSRRVGNIVHEAIGSNTYTVMLHSPWPDTRAAVGLAFAANGMIDDIIKNLPEDERMFGFDLSGSPFDEIVIYNSSYNEDYDRLTFGQLTDGYVVLGAIADYEPVSAIPAFIDENNLADTLARFPGPKEEMEITAKDMNDFIAGSIGNYKDLFAKF